MPSRLMMRDLGLFVREQAVAGDREATRLLTEFHRRRVAGGSPACDRCGATLGDDQDFAVYGDGLVLCVRCQTPEAPVEELTEREHIHRMIASAQSIVNRLSAMEQAERLNP